MKRFLFVVFTIMIVVPAAYAGLSAAKFPGTFNDIPLPTRIEYLAEGYKPFLDAKAYQELNVVPGEEIFIDHMIAEAEAEAEEQEQDAETMDADEYCQKHPSDDERCPQLPPIIPPQTPPHETTYTGYTIGGGPVIENNFVTGGSCYPPDYDRHFTNKILTTGRFEKQYPAFEKALITIFRKEGKCGTIKGDPCGYTCYGIGSGPKCMGVVVHSRQEAEDIYYERFWKKYGLYKLPDVISTDIMIAGMAGYIGTTMNQFRKMLGLPTNSKKIFVDEEMINATRNYQGDIHNDWMDVRDKFLEQVANGPRYNGSVLRGYKNAIEIKRKNGCHIQPEKPLYR